MLIDAYGHSKKQKVMHDTWGHLRAVPQHLYHGHILFALGSYGDIVIIECDFDGLSDSPWFFDHLNAYVDLQAEKRRDNQRHSIWRFDGSYRARKNGSGAFTGKIIAMRAIATERARRAEGSGS